MSTATAVVTTTTLLLATPGRDYASAFKYLPYGDEPEPSGQINAVPVSDDEIAASVGDLALTTLGLHADDEFRISNTGMQEKTALL